MLPFGPTGFKTSRLRSPETGVARKRRGGRHHLEVISKIDLDSLLHLSAGSPVSEPFRRTKATGERRRVR